MLDYAQLTALAAVLREGSFERAARVLHLTPSAVSQRVRALEARVGEVLVVRSQPARATPAGAQLARHAEQVALLEQDLRAALPQLGSADVPHVTLPLAVNADSLATWFMPAAARLASAHGVLVDVVIDDQDLTAERLKRGEVVAAVTTLAEPVPGCTATPLGRMTYVAAAAPAFMTAALAQAPLAQALACAPSIAFTRADGLVAQWLAAWWQAQGLAGPPPLPPTHWMPSSSGYVAACIAGLGWGVHPEALIAPHLAAGTLVALAPDVVLTVPLHWQCRAALPLARALTALVRAAAAPVCRPMP